MLCLLVAAHPLAALVLIAFLRPGPHGDALLTLAGLMAGVLALFTGLALFIHSDGDAGGRPGEGPSPARGSRYQDPGVEVQAMRCPVCAGALGDAVRCPGCETPHHAECWGYNRGCATYACGQRTATRLPRRRPPQ